MNFSLWSAISRFSVISRFSAISRRIWKTTIARILLIGVLGLSCLMLMGTPAAWAGIDDDRYDGNIFALYAGNGSLFPARVTLAEAFQRDKPIVLVFFVDDSSDCKLYAQIASEIDAFYGRATNIIPINADALPIKAHYEPTEPGYYYKGLVPQTVVLDQSHQVLLNEVGNIPFEQTDDLLRQVFGLLPRSESVELKRRTVNEFNTELTQE